MRGENVVTRTFNTTIGASVSGSGPLTFQWFKENQPLVGATSAALTITNITQEDAGNYQLEVSNAFGSTRGPMYPLIVVPHNTPSFQSDERQHIVLNPHGYFNLTPILRSHSGAVTYQWFFNNQPLADETEATLRLEGDSSPTGQYHLVATNVVGSGRTPYFTVDRSLGTDSPDRWLDHLRHGNRVYFLLPASNLIRVYDLDLKSFLSDIPLQDAGNRFIMLEGKIYYLSGTKSVRRVGIDGQGDELVYQTESYIGFIYGMGHLLYAKVGSSARPVLIDTDSLVVSGPGGTYWPSDFARNVSVAPSLRRIFTVTDVPHYLNLDSSGKYVDHLRVSNWDGVPLSTQSWVVHDDKVLVTNGGSCYRTSNLSFATSLGPVAGLDESADGDLYTIQSRSIVRFGPDLREKGRLPLSSNVDAIAVHGSNVFLFRQPISDDDYIKVSEVSTFWFGALPLRPAQRPASGTLNPSFVLQDKRGDLLMINPDHTSVEIWSAAARGFTGNIRLAESPLHATYSSAWDKLLLGYSDGRVMQIDLSKGINIWESGFARAPSNLLGMVAAGNYFVMADSVGAWESHLSYNQFGFGITRLEWGQEFQLAAWNENAQRLFHTHNGWGRLSSTTMLSNGQLTRHNDVSPVELDANRTIAFNPAGDQVLVDTGAFFNTQTLQRSNQLASDLDAAVWLGNRLYTAKTEARNVRLTRWGASNYGQDATTAVPGSDPHLFTSPDGELILVTRAFDRTIFSLFDADLNPIHRQSHRGANLLDDSVRLSNLSSRVNLSENADTPLVVGFVIQGEAPMRLLLRAVGPGLAEFGINDHVIDPQIRVYDASSQLVTTNDDWASSRIETIEVAASAVGAFPLDSGSADAALVLTLAPGAYTAHVSRARGEGRNVLFEAYDYNEPGTPSRLINMSNRTDAGSGPDALVVGFVVSGGSAQPLLLRAVGAALAEFGVEKPLWDPMLTVRDAAQTIVAENDNWQNDALIREAASFTGAFALPYNYRHDAAVLSELNPGPHTATVSSALEDDFGNVLIEIYEIED